MIYMYHNHYHHGTTTITITIISIFVIRNSIESMHGIDWPELALCSSFYTWPHVNVIFEHLFYKISCIHNICFGFHFLMSGSPLKICSHSPVLSHSQSLCLQCLSHIPYCNLFLNGLFCMKHCSNLISFWYFAFSFRRQIHVVRKPIPIFLPSIALVFVLKVHSVNTCLIFFLNSKTWMCVWEILCW